MASLTKDQMQKLSPEQQEAFASMLTTQARWRQELLKQARQQWLYRITAGIFLVAAVALAVFQAGSAPLMAIPMVLIATAVQVHAALLHRRLDALLALLNADSTVAAATDAPGCHTA